MLQQLARLDASCLTCSGSNGGGDDVPPSSGSTTTLSGAFLFPAPHGAFANPAAQYALLPFPVMLPQAFAWPFPNSPRSTRTTGAFLVEISPMRDGSDNTVIINQHEDGNESNWLTESNMVHLLDEQKANQFREPEFDPKAKDDIAWQPTEAMLRFLEKHFNQSLTEEWKAILNDFPIPKCSILQAPKLDPEVKDQLCKKGRNLQFGTECCLYRV